jgi:hypothetical protein
VSISAKDCERLCTNFKACCSANGKLWNRLNISLRKVELGYKALLDIDGPGPDDQVMMEEAMLETFFECGSSTNVCEWPNVKLTSDDINLFFGEDDQSETKSSSLSTSNSGTISPSSCIHIFSKVLWAGVYIFSNVLYMVT